MEPKKTGMSFSGALLWLKEGFCVRRSGWPRGRSVFLCDGAEKSFRPADETKDPPVDYETAYTFTASDLLAEDWEVAL